MINFPGNHLCNNVKSWYERERENKRFNVIGWPTNIAPWDVVKENHRNREKLVTGVSKKRETEQMKLSFPSKTIQVEADAHATVIWEEEIYSVIKKLIDLQGELFQINFDDWRCRYLPAVASTGCCVPLTCAHVRKMKDNFRCFIRKWI